MYVHVVLCSSANPCFLFSYIYLLFSCYKHCNNVSGNKHFVLLYCIDMKFHQKNKDNNVVYNTDLTCDNVLIANKLDVHGHDVEC